MVQSRYGCITTPSLVDRGALPTKITTFIAESEARAGQKPSQPYDPDELATNYNLLQVWDMLSSTSA